MLIGNRDTLSSSGVCLVVPLVLDGHTLSVDLFVLPIYRADVVLGAQWLATLGPIVMDYKALTMSFTWLGLALTFQGKQSQHVEPIHFHQLERLLQVDSVADTYHLYSFADQSSLTDDNLSTPQPSLINEVLIGFVKVFETSSKLPLP